MPWIAGALSFFPAAVRHRIVIGGRRGRPSESADCAAPPSSGRVRCAGSPLAVSVRRTGRSREKKEKKNRLSRYATTKHLFKVVSRIIIVFLFIT